MFLCMSKEKINEEKTNRYIIIFEENRYIILLSSK